MGATNTIGGGQKNGFSKIQSTPYVVSDTSLVNESWKADCFIYVLSWGEKGYSKGLIIKCVPVYVGQQKQIGQLEYTILVSAGADYRVIKWSNTG